MLMSRGSCGSSAAAHLQLQTDTLLPAAQGQVPKRALTAADLFSAHCPLHEVLLRHLQRALSALKASEAAAHPSLYPVLVLLSRLRCWAPTAARHSGSACLLLSHAPCSLCCRSTAVKDVAIASMPRELLCLDKHRWPCQSLLGGCRRLVWPGGWVSGTGCYWSNK